MGLRISRRPFLYSSHLIIEVLDKRKCTGLPIPIFHKAEAAFICANNTFLIVSQFLFNILGIFGYHRPRRIRHGGAKDSIIICQHEHVLHIQKNLTDTCMLQAVSQRTEVSYCL